MKLAALIEPKKIAAPESPRFSNREIIKLAIPVIIEQFLAILVGMADTLMVSYIGEEAVSGVSLVNQLNNVFILVFSAMASGGAVVVSQYIGKKDQAKGNRTAGQLFLSSAVISVVITILVLIFSRPLFTLLFGTVDAGVMDAGIEYLTISAFSFPFIAIYNSGAGIYRSMGKTRTTMIVSLCMNVINVGGNAIGVFVLHAGVAGVAYPSLISRVFAAVVMFLLVLNRKNCVFVRMKDIFGLSWDIIRKIFHIALPQGAEMMLFQLSKVVLSAMIATFGVTQIAANGVAQSFWNMAALFNIAMGPVYITIIGQYMGAGETDGAEYYMRKLTRMTMVGSVLWNAAFFGISMLLLPLYNISAETTSLVIILLIIHNIPDGFVGPMAFSVSSGLRAAGDIRYTTLAAIFSTCICRVALSFLFAQALQMGVIGITIAMICDWIIKAALIFVHYRNGKWKTFKMV